jgi:hypothetical protein
MDLRAEELHCCAHCGVRSEGRGSCSFNCRASHQISRKVLDHPEPVDFYLTATGASSAVRNRAICIWHRCPSAMPSRQRCAFAPNSGIRVATEDLWVIWSVRAGTFARIALCLIWACFPVQAGEIAFSLIHRTERIDVSAHAIRKIEAKASQVIAFKTGRRVEYPFAHVEICFSKGVRKRICRLTRRIVEEPLEVVVGCETVVRPVVREPLCGSCFIINTSNEGDATEAEKIAEKLRGKSTKTCSATS